MDATAMDRPAFQPRTASEQHPARAVAGPRAFAAVAVAGAVGVALLIVGASNDSSVLAGVGVVVVAAVAMACAGFIVVAPNESKVLILLGRYIGTVTTAGMVLGQPAHDRVARDDLAAGAQLPERSHEGQRRRRQPHSRSPRLSCGGS